MTPEVFDIAGVPRAHTTARLRLLAPALDHAPVVMESIALSLPSLRFISWGQRPFADLEEAQRFCRDGLAMVEAGDCLIFHAFSRDSGAYVGRVDLHSFDWDAPRAEIGYVGDVRHAGQGLMREAVLAVTTLAFDLGFQRVHALSDIRNHRALAFAATLEGYRREGELRAFERDPWGQLSTQVMFAAVHPQLSL